MKKSISALLLTVIASGAHAVVIYDWTGVCSSGCTTATAVLTLADTYAPGAATSSQADFISFEVMIDGVSDDLDQFDAPDLLPGSDPIFGGFDPTLPEILLFDAVVSGSTFRVSAASWTLVVVDPSTFATRLSAGGETSSFLLRAVDVPEPASLGLLAVGLAGVGFARRRPGYFGVGVKTHKLAAC